MIIQKAKSRRSADYENFDKLYWKCLQDILIDKIEYEALCNNFTKLLDEMKNESFVRNTNKTKFFQ